MIYNSKCCRLLHVLEGAKVRPFLSFPFHRRRPHMFWLFKIILSCFAKHPVFKERFTENVLVSLLPLDEDTSSVSCLGSSFRSHLFSLLFLVSLSFLSFNFSSLSSSFVPVFFSYSCKPTFSQKSFFIHPFLLLFIVEICGTTEWFSSRGSVRSLFTSCRWRINGAIWMGKARPPFIKIISSEFGK